MTSVKRLLIDEDAIDDVASRRDYHHGAQFDDRPHLSTQSWPNVWDELLGTNLTNNISNGITINRASSPSDSGTNELHSTLHDPLVDSLVPHLSVTNVESDIESWATQQFSSIDGSSLPASQNVPSMLSRAGSNDGSSVCYGMVYRSRVKLIGNMPEHTTQLNSKTMPTVGSHYVFGLIWRDSNLVVTLPDGTGIALANNNLTEALEGPFSQNTIEMEALAHTANLHDAIGAATRASDAHTTMNINIYGSPEHAAKVGRLLSANKVWLQRPDWHKPRVQYDNPHVLKLPGRYDNDVPGIIRDEADVGEGPTMKAAISNVLSSLTRGSHLKRLEGDSRLKTRLLPHQEEALDFMTQRETGPIPEQFHLWKKVTVDDRTEYQHAITGIKARYHPDETGGGILADDMGMGKTFSILALLIRTLEDAWKWSRDDTVHLASGIPATKRLSRATLVVVPSPLLLNSWKYEIFLRIAAELKVITYHGQDRPEDIAELADSDIILTTYHTLVADHSRRNAPLNQIAWFRIVLDEAHFIRRQATLLHKRVTELDAKYRWCLTGTPIQNHLDDIGALFVFVRATPFDKLGMFRRHIASPFSEGGSDRLTSQKHLAMLIDSVCVRRTKELLSLKDHHEIERLVQLSAEETKQYERTHKDMDRALRHLAGGVEDTSRFGMFQAQLQLRILCNHGTWQHQFYWANTRSLRDMREDALNSVANDGEVVCCICEQPMPVSHTNQVYRTYGETCSHVLCSDCLGEGKDGCPLCEAATAMQRSVQSASAGHDRHSRDNYFRTEGHSSKMEALMTDLMQDMQSNKSIVFSCWTTTLDLIALHLKQRNIAFERIDGEASFKHRQQILDRFEGDQVYIPVLIMTTGVGAFGLNLTAANRIFLVEPQWNPSVENQAIGRALRIGQAREVTVTRYIVKGTVEQKMQLLQKRKIKMAELAGNTKADMTMIVDDELD